MVWAEKPESDRFLGTKRMRCLLGTIVIVVCIMLYRGGDLQATPSRLELFPLFEAGAPETTPSWRNACSAVAAEMMVIDCGTTVVSMVSSLGVAMDGLVGWNIADNMFQSSCGDSFNLKGVYRFLGVGKGYGRVDV
jgi:hypothetical protein